MVGDIPKIATGDLLCRGLISLLVAALFVIGPVSQAMGSVKVLSFVQDTGQEGFTLEGQDCRVKRRFIKPNQTLFGILRDQKVPYPVIHRLVQKSASVFDVRKLRAGHGYSLISNLSNKLLCLVYEETPVDYVVFQVKEPVHVYRGEKKVTVTLRRASGSIQSTLCQALKKEKLPYELGLGLSELYAWTIDFHHLQKGDHFRVLFEEKAVGGKAAGLGRIIGAKFVHRGQPHYAFYFKKEGRGGYYDQEGKSLRKAFLKAPLKYGCITSPYNRRRLHPVLKRYRPHLGIDYAAPKGAPIMSVADGVVQKAAYHRECGNYVKIRHSGVYATEYLHLSRFAKGIRPGAAVNQGDIIGYVGSTGLATGPHVEYRLWKNGIAVNPSQERAPAAKPIGEEWLKEFESFQRELRACLDQDQCDKILLGRGSEDTMPTRLTSLPR